MEVVRSNFDIDRNLRLLEEVRAAGQQSRFFEAYRTLIVGGRCFIPYDVDGVLHFAPSRFVGYKGVTFQKHAESDELDGKKTNPAISRVLDVPLVDDTRLEEAYKEFLRAGLGYQGPIPMYRRKYWLTDEADRVLLAFNNDDIDLAGVSETARQAIITARKGQSEFRKALIKYWQGCAVTGCKKISVLKASHIKPWRVSSNEERVDPWNGLLLTPNLDALFDSGLISFNSSGSVICSRALSKSEREILMPQPSRRIGLSQRHAAYLEYHRQHVFTP